MGAPIDAGIALAISITCQVVARTGLLAAPGGRLGPVYRKGITMFSMMKTIYTISNCEGLQSPAWREQYSELSSAVEAVRLAMGWDEIVESDWYTVDNGQAESLYATQSDCDADGTGAHAPRVIELELDGQDADDDMACDAAMDREVGR